MWLAFGSETRELRDGAIVVGSGADADWRLPTADLMPRHFTVTVYDLNVSLRPVSKDIVVAVNGVQLSGAPRLLNDGDVISAGSGRFVFSEDVPRLTPVGSPAVGRAFLIDESRNVAYELVSRSTQIGRDSSNAIVVRDAGASRFHAEVRREAGGFALHSMGSSGTMRNGRRVDGPVLLDEGDTIEVAFARYRFGLNPPESVPVASVGDPGPTLRRGPTLETGKISVVPPKEPLSGLGKVLMAAFLIAVVVAAVWLGVRFRLCPRGRVGT
jgi:pSer/pThr/pTyr-binding forkhead associated (FHA) protein